MEVQTNSNSSSSSSYAEKLSHLTTTDEKLCLVMEHIDNYSRALNDYLIESKEKEKQINSELKQAIETLEINNMELKQEITTTVETLLNQYHEITNNNNNNNNNNDNDTDNIHQLLIVKLNNVVTVIRGKRHLHGRLIGHNGSKIKQLHDKYKGVSIIIPSISENNFTDIIIYNLNSDYRTADDLINEIAEILSGNY